MADLHHEHSTDTSAEQEPAQAQVSREIIRRRYKKMPIGMYHIKEKALDVVTNANFVDSILILVAFISAVSFAGFYPLVLIVLIMVLLFAATLFRPFLGLIVFNIVLFPVYIYQTPVLAWFFFVAATAILIYGYVHYRLAVFTYALIGMAFSPLGYLFEIPLFVFAVLTIGNKRAILSIIFTVLVVVMFSGVTGMQNSGYIAYNAQQAHTLIAGSGAIGTQVIALDTLLKPSYSILNFSSGAANTFSKFVSLQVTGIVPPAAGILVEALGSGAIFYIVQSAILIGIIIAIDWYAATSRSRFKGTYASLFAIAYPISFLLLSTGTSTAAAIYVIPFASFLIAPISVYLLEYYDISVVKVLDVKKQDIRMKFGEAFEDLAAGNVTERFDDIGNYETIKAELREAIINPIEERGVSQAYHLQPSKGILFFGPPGSGKTMMMRALANEIHAGFFYVKATNLISAYPGESERMIVNVFTIARKNAPCVLFIDEIDSVALSRENPSIDDTHRHALSQILVEMDGFQKVNNVIIVGATNRPDLLDKAITRPGRFDRLIYMPLPDLAGRRKIFKIYLEHLPTTEDIDLKQLAERTERYSGADIKAVCDSVAQMAAHEATSEHKILQITQEDILNVVKSSKPSTSLAQLDDYKRFRLDFERSAFKKEGEEKEQPQAKMDDVVGLEPAKKAVREAIEIPLAHPELIKKYDIKTINGLLMFGPPGSGKTMLMRAISSEIKGVTMLELSGAELSEAGLEAATSTIREIFNRAKENAPSVIFIEEIDGVIPKREGATELGAQITAEMLKEIDGIKQLSNVVIVAATNRPEMLDPAILRPGRFDKLIFVKPPSPANRAELFRRFLANAPCGSLDYQKLSQETKGFTGADISAVCREAKTVALESELSTGSEGKVTMETLGTIIKNTRPSAPDEVVAQYMTFLQRYGQR